MRDEIVVTILEEQLISSIIDLFLGGAETASNAIG